MAWAPSLKHLADLLREDAMDITTATKAGDIASKIADRQKAVEVVQRAMSEGWLVSDLCANSPDGANSVPIILGVLDADTSKQVLGFALQIYQGQLDALNAELAAL